MAGRWSNLITGRKANLTGRTEAVEAPGSLGVGASEVKSNDAPTPPASSLRARVQQHKPGVMNKTEQAYADLLEQEKRDGLIVWYGFECVTLKLADDCRYTPDFMVITAEGYVEFREVKGGFIRDDSKVKIRVAAEKFSLFSFRMFQKLSKKDGGGWKVLQF